MSYPEKKNKGNIPLNYNNFISELINNTQKDVNVDDALKKIIINNFKNNQKNHLIINDFLKNEKNNDFLKNKKK